MTNRVLWNKKNARGIFSRVAVCQTLQNNSVQQFIPCFYLVQGTRMSHQSELISTDIDSYLAQHEHKMLLRCLTCGSVDDGKSTLIGRLLHDSKMIYEDQLSAVQSDSVKSGTVGAGKIDLALLVDGLQAEREQGITIDVAYRYFSTTSRKFIIADTPGHEQYTRNMVTGASTCDLAIVLIDARYGVQTQTKRHSFIASLLGIKYIVIAINKMDLIKYSEAIYQKIKQDTLEFTQALAIKSEHIQFIPISALDGDNVVNKSEKMAWYQGKTMMDILNTVEIDGDFNALDARFSVQYVNRPHLDFRGFCGTVASGVFQQGDTITVLPSSKTSKIKSIVTNDGNLSTAFAPLAVTLMLEDEIDISRGDMIIGNSTIAPQIAHQFDATLVWMTEKRMQPSRQYIIKLSTHSVLGHISSIHYRIDVNTLLHHPADTLKINEIAVTTLSFNDPVVFDNYQQNKGTGAFIVIDRLSNNTVGAGMISRPTHAVEPTRLGHINVRDSRLADQQSARNQHDDTVDDTAGDNTVNVAKKYRQQAVAINFIGSNNLTIVDQLETKLFTTGHASIVFKNPSAYNESLIATLKQTGLICLLVDAIAIATDKTIVCKQDTTMTDIYSDLQRQKIIF